LGVLLVILLLGKLAGGKRAGVTDMLLVGTVVNRGLQLVMNYLQTGMDTDTLEIYQEYAQNSQNYFNTFADVGILALVAAVVLLPLMGMRFSYNLVSFADEDGQTLGVRPAAMRVYGLVAGGILTATAMIHAGNIGMIATVTPLLCRYIYGADFKNLMGTSAIWGAALLLAANILRGFTYIGTYQIPLGNLVSLLAVPLLIWVVWKQKTAWSTYER
jgi:iron complex transport system permease protein